MVCITHPTGSGLGDGDREIDLCAMDDTINKESAILGSSRQTFFEVASHVAATSRIVHLIVAASNHCDSPPRLQAVVCLGHH